MYIIFLGKMFYFLKQQERTMMSLDHWWRLNHFANTLIYLNKTIASRSPNFLLRMMSATINMMRSMKPVVVPSTKEISRYSEATNLWSKKFLGLLWLFKSV